jgi:hypothetical protein
MDRSAGVGSLNRFLIAGLMSLEPSHTSRSGLLNQWDQMRREGKGVEGVFGERSGWSVHAGRSGGWKRSGIMWKGSRGGGGGGNFPANGKGLGVIVAQDGMEGSWSLRKGGCWGHGEG